jgi:hypothetical protein
MSSDAWKTGYVNQYQDPTAHQGWLAGAKSNYLGDLATQKSDVGSDRTVWGGVGSLPDYLLGDRAYGVSQWGDYKDPSTVGSEYARPRYENYVSSLGGKDFSDLSYDELSQLGRLHSGDRHSLTGGTMSNVRRFLGDAIPITAGAMIAGGALSGFGGAGAAGGATGAEMGSVASLAGAEAGLTGGAIGGFGGTATGAGLGLGAAGTAAGSSGMGLTDYLSLAGGLTDMYGQYQAGEAQEDAIRRAEAAQRAGAAYGTQAYAPYAAAGGPAVPKPTRRNDANDGRPFCRYRDEPIICRPEITRRTRFQLIRASIQQGI